MTLVQWWLDAPERVSPKIPPIIKALLVPWLLIGIVVALVPELQTMRDGLRLILGLPAAFGILWMATGLSLMIADKLIALGKFLRKAH